MHHGAKVSMLHWLLMLLQLGSRLGEIHYLLFTMLRPAASFAATACAACCLTQTLTCMPAVMV